MKAWKLTFIFAAAYGEVAQVVLTDGITIISIRAGSNKTTKFDQ